MDARDWIALAALIVAIPAMVLSTINVLHDKFRLSCFFRVKSRIELYEDIKEKTPSDFCRLSGVLEYINYSPYDFYIHKIQLKSKKQIYPVEQFNDEPGVRKLTYPVIPFKHIPIFQRSSNEISLVIDIPKSTKWEVFEIYIFTSYRKRPYKYPIYDSIQESPPNLLSPYHLK